MEKYWGHKKVHLASLGVYWKHKVVGILPRGATPVKKMPRFVCWGSEIVHILKDALGKKNIPILRGSSAYFIPILWCNIRLKCIIPKCHLQSIIC